MTIGERIQSRRKALGLSADELAELLGKNRATIYRYEGGDIEKLPTTILEGLARALRTTPSYLMGWDEEPAPPQPNGQALDQSNIYMIPIYETVSAGFGAYADDHVTGYEPVYLSSEREARETLASLSSSAGVKPESLQRIIGHASYTTTADVYIHHDLEGLIEEMRKLRK